MEMSGLLVLLCNGEAAGVHLNSLFNGDDLKITQQQQHSRLHPHSHLHQQQ